MKSYPKMYEARLNVVEVNELQIKLKDKVLCLCAFEHLPKEAYVDPPELNKIYTIEAISQHYGKIYLKLQEVDGHYPLINFCLYRKYRSITDNFQVSCES